MNQNRRVVLIVDDDPWIRRAEARFVNQFFGRDGVEVLQAESGEAALQIMENRGSEIDLVLTDVNMSGMTGFALKEALLKQKFPEEAILVVSDEVGADLAKPFGAEEFLAALRKVFPA